MVAKEESIQRIEEKKCENVATLKKVFEITKRQTEEFHDAEAKAKLAAAN